MAYGILDVVKDAVMGTTQWSSPEVIQERLRICNTPMASGSGANVCENQKFGVCTKCGCVVESKVKYAESECPIGRWKPVGK